MRCDFVAMSSFSMQSIQNLGLAVISQVAGTIVDKKGYLVLEVFFCAWLCSKCLFLWTSFVATVSAVGIRQLGCLQCMFVYGY